MTSIIIADFFYLFWSCMQIFVQKYRENFIKIHGVTFQNADVFLVTPAHPPPNLTLYSSFFFFVTFYFFPLHIWPSCCSPSCYCSVPCLSPLSIFSLLICICLPCNKKGKREPMLVSYHAWRITWSLSKIDWLTDWLIVCLTLESFKCVFPLHILFRRQVTSVCRTVLRVTL
jgi:hypothetical protein